TRGAAGTGPLPGRGGRRTLLRTARPLPADLLRRQRRGIGVVVLPFARDTSAYWGRLKLVGHPSAVVGRIAAARRGAGEALYRNAAGEVTEATAANVFVAERGAVVTPPLAAGILAGVTRAIAIDLLRRAGVEVREERIPVARLRR